MHFPRRLAATSASVMLGLGVAALINTAMARNAERRNPPKGTFIEVDGVRLHYLEKGSGSPVVLLHGNQSMAEDFVISGVIDLLAKKYRVIAFDRPGFGYSERPGDTVWTPSAQADLISKALLRLGVEKSLMVGHSWGTLVALAYGLQNPSQTAAILLLSGYYFPTKRLDVVFASLPAIPIVGDILRYTVWPLLGWLAGPLLLKTIFAPAHVTERFKREFPFSMALRPSQIRATAGDSALMVEPHPMRLHGLVRQSTLDVIAIDLRGMAMRGPCRRGAPGRHRAVRAAGAPVVRSRRPADHRGRARRGHDAVPTNYRRGMPSGWKRCRTTCETAPPPMRCG
jgi:pimeloyl-ACP methyl ester carboxylesterase